MWEDPVLKLSNTKINKRKCTCGLRWLLIKDSTNNNIPKNIWVWPIRY